MEIKQEYIAPTLKCVEVAVEQGFALSQGISNRGNYRTRNERPTDQRQGGAPSAYHFQFGFSYTDDENGDWD